MPLSLFVDRQKGVESVASMLQQEDLETQSASLMSQEEICKIQELVKKLKAKKVLGIDKPIGKESLEEFLHPTVIPVEDDSAFLDENDNHNEELSECKKELADLKRRSDELEKENGLLHSQLSQYKNLCQANSEKIMEMRKFHYKDQSHLTPEEVEEIKTLKEEVAKLTKLFLNTENQLYATKSKVQKLFNENEQLRVSHQYLRQWHQRSYSYGYHW